MKYLFVAWGNKLDAVGLVFVIVGLASLYPVDKGSEWICIGVGILCWFISGALSRKYGQGHGIGG